ncbi:gamma-glutamyltransferase family protein [Thermoplasma volcanium]|nr:gamma-glutamyltransferase family protein [Thermoplasma volcanium]
MRPTVFSSKAVISSSSLSASLAGAKIIEKGGNIFDAAIAVSSVLSVTQNNLCGLGGDAFALVRYNGRVKGYNGSGKSSRNVNRGLYFELGYSRIPERGIYSAITVPGLVDLWNSLYLEYATMRFSDLISDAIKYAETGFYITRHYEESLIASSPILGQYNWSNQFMPYGKIPAEGDLFIQKDLAGTLREIAEEGPRSFYDGYLSDIIFKAMEKTNLLIDSKDLSDHKTLAANPVKSTYMDYDVFETAPNSQGATVNYWLALLEQKIQNKIPRPVDIVESGLEAYRWRSMFIGDPERMPFNGDLLSKGAGPYYNNPRVPEDKGDTTYFSISDANGNSISMIQSNYMGFGSGIIPEGTGFVLQNRGSYFTLDDKHHNSLEPRKRTFHTLAACIIEKDGELVYSLGTMGGDIQPQVQVQIITGLINQDLMPQEAIERPRWAFPATIYEQPSVLNVEDTSLINENETRLRINPMKYSSSFGTAQVTALLNGRVAGGSDPRGDGFSIPV